MLNEGYNIYSVEDACGATSQAAHDAALSRMVQAGAVRLTTIATVLEFQRDWAKRDHCNDPLNLLREHGPMARTSKTAIRWFARRRQRAK